MNNRSFASNLGIYAYAAAAIVLGLTGFAWSDFAGGWQRVGPNVPFRTFLAYTAAFAEFLGGVALLWRPWARTGAAILTVVYSIFTLLWVPKILESPMIYDGWGNFFEELSAVIGGLVLCASLAPRDSAWARNEARITRSYGICPISFAIVHIVSFSILPAWIPKWIPPGRIFWAVTTTVCFLLAAFAILSGIFAPLAARLLTAEIVGFEILVWMPKLFSAPRDHFSWAGNAICVLLAGAVWVVSDSISEAARRKAAIADSRMAVGSLA